MENLKKVYATKDNDGHWYIIPAEMTDEFRRLRDGGESTEDEFIEKFSNYMTGGDLNLVQLYANI
jgi:hypothetical protein